METEKVLSSFGKKIFELRKQRNLTQEKFSEICGIHRTYTSSLESGTRNPSLTTLFRISNALGITLSELLDFVSDE